MLEGGCACGSIRYEISEDPLIVHACHCRDCQRITGGPFVINLVIEKKYVRTAGPSPRSATLQGGSGSAHEVYFCGDCGTYLWSQYRIVPAECWFVRAGTLDAPDAVEPDIHIYTRTKLPWIELPPNARSAESIYEVEKVWRPEMIERLRRTI